jgi:predicted metalloprotease with PDZ domain
MRTRRSTDQRRQIGTENKAQQAGVWEKEEDAALSSAVARIGARDWKQVASEVGTRDHVQCAQRWLKALKPGLRITLVVEALPLGINLKHHGTSVEVDDVVEGGPAQMGGVLEGDVLTHIQIGLGHSSSFCMGLLPRDHLTGKVVPCAKIGGAIQAGLEKWGQTRLRFHRSPPQ